MISPISSPSVVPDRFSLDRNLDLVVRDGGVIDYRKLRAAKCDKGFEAGGSGQ
jgi:hypothetical protein